MGEWFEVHWVASSYHLPDRAGQCGHLTALWTPQLTSWSLTSLIGELRSSALQGKF